jgi:hypothetical protein
MMPLLHLIAELQWAPTTVQPAPRLCGPPVALSTQLALSRVPERTGQPRHREVRTGTGDAALSSTASSNAADHYSELRALPHWRCHSRLGGQGRDQDPQQWSPNALLLPPALQL